MKLTRVIRLIGLLLSLFPGVASAEDLAVPSPRSMPTVSLVVPSEIDRGAATRLASELLSEGYAVEWQEGLSPCEASDGGDSEQEERVWIRFVPASEGTANLRTLVCYRSASGRLFRAQASASNGDSATLALSTVEAVNGLRSGPVGTSGSLEGTPREAPSSLPPSSFSAGAAFVFAPPDLPPLLGPRLELASAITSHLSLAFDGFVSVRASEIERVDRRIEVCTAWARVGPRLGGPFSVANVDASLLAGPAFVWTQADAVAPLLGSQDSTAAGIVTLGIGAELPRRTVAFLRVAAQGSLLLPRVTVETGNGAIPAWIFVETSLAVGLRWPGAGSSR